MKTKMYFCAAVLFALASGCNREETKPSGTTETTQMTVSNTPTYLVKYEAMAAKLKIGMVKDDVRKALGDPSETRGIYGGGKNYGLWMYEVDKNISLRIKFDDNDNVATWNMASENVTQ